MYHLVIVDDEEKILDGISELFPWNNIGFEVVARFTDANSALSYVEVNPVDVVMTDISMPVMNGISLTKELKRFPHINIVLFSSYQDYEYMRAGIHYGISDYLLKPIRYEELVACFDKIRMKLDETNKVIENKPKTYYSEIIKRVDNYLQNNYQKASLEGAAEIAGLSPNYLSKIYKEKSGSGFLEKLNKIRMEKASELLMDPNYKSYEIAFYVGYDNPKNFSRAFKTYYNVSPMDYRNGIRKENR
ncbi:response regulator transcription factor [Anaerocolumna sp. MB42-C2]|uniref:response regulator transcription factor n=1 Tax=Anaerocolumna sp. MB42-C2 TaxID=3070997 RepID=UPI0027DECD23|nr:response regulator [Anaerocolumna sp. MB42-C2]WMJ87261.1 response regulator [Anaerocolumna sp. MB42-C2]